MRFLRLTVALGSTGLGLGLLVGACSSDPAAEPPVADAAAPDTNVDVDEADTSPRVHIVGGRLTGLDGTGLVLQNNTGDDLAVANNGVFTFGTRVAAGTAVAVTVKAEPRKQTCTVTGGTGTVADGDFTTIAVDCKTDKFVVGGTAMGLAAQVVLQNNGGDNVTLKADGAFTFPIALKTGVTYGATVKTQPSAPAQTCLVTKGTGTIASADVTDVTIACTTNAYTIGGNATGLAAAPLGLVLQNNLGDDLPILGDGAFVFTSPVASGATYAITVKTKPLGYNCALVFAAGNVLDLAITNVRVQCVAM